MRDRREELIRRWTKRVLEDPRVPEANRLAEPELRDEVPDLLDRLIDDLGAADGGESRRRAEGAREVAREHARQRFTLGYGVAEALRELGDLRVAILDLWMEEGLPIPREAAAVLHAAIDDTMIAGADEMERMAQEKQQWLSELLDQSHEAVMVWRLGGGLVLWNRGAEELYGWPLSEARGQSPHALLHTRHHGGDMREVERAVTRKGRWQGELQHTARDGRQLVVESRWVVRSDRGQVLVLEKNRDVTERRRAEEEREQLLESERAARTEAERATRLRDEFVATVSHELRTPLNAILGWTGMLRRSKLDAAASAKALEVVERNAQAQAELVEDLLDISRIGSGKLRLDVRPVNFAAVLENVIASHLPSAQAKGVRIDRVLDAAGCTIRGDPGRLEQIASNLLSNAVKFTPRGGHVSVSCQRRGSRAELTVRDTGKGIAADFVPHLFERFRQAEASLTRHHRGLGLGLSLVKFLVEQHGGDIRAESEGEGRGSTFTVTLPIAAVGQAEEKASPIDACGSLAGIRALVIDDEEDARTLIRRILEDCEVSVTAVGSAVEALEQLPQVRPDVLISDIGMPELDGYHLIRAVRALPVDRGGATPAVALTAFARPEDRLRALRAGYQMHLAKPVDQSELLVVVASLAGRLVAPLEPGAPVGR